jgi:hypothetical protein
MIGPELQWRFVKSLWLGAALLAAAFCGLLLAVAGNFFILVYLFVPILWFALLPYHSRISLYGIVAFMSSSFIVPFIPGRPFLWEMFSLLGWSGVIVTMALREQAPDSAFRIRRNGLLLVGVVIFAIVLVLTMKFRGAGIRALGASDKIGGRVYYQQIMVSVFPFLMCIVAPKEKMLIRLFIFQCLFSLSFVFADFAYSYAKGPLYQVLNFVELPIDGDNFEGQAMSGGIRRFQSLFFFTLGLLYLIWMKIPFSTYVKPRGLLLWLITIALIGIGLFSGHRYTVYITAAVAFTIAFSQRIFTPARLLIMVAPLVLLYFFLLVFVRELPLAVQRTVSFVPGIVVEPVVARDAETTINDRVRLRRIGLEMAPKYMWLGRGFQKYRIDPTHYPDLTYMSADEGIFYNGAVSALVILGLPGAFATLLIVVGGSISAWRVMMYVRRYQLNDDFSRMACVNCGIWFANAFCFVFLHGDSALTMQTLIAPASMVIICEYHLGKRVRDGLTEVTLPELPKRRFISIVPQVA